MTERRKTNLLPFQVTLQTEIVIHRDDLCSVVSATVPYFLPNDFFVARFIVHPLNLTYAYKLTHRRILYCDICQTDTRD